MAVACSIVRASVGRVLAHVYFMLVDMVGMQDVCGYILMVVTMLSDSFSMARAAEPFFYLSAAMRPARCGKCIIVPGRGKLYHSVSGFSVSYMT